MVDDGNGSCARPWPTGDTLTYDNDNRLSTWNSQPVSFDDDGNMINGPLPGGSQGAYVYDARNRLTSAGGSTYRYNPDGAKSKGSCLKA